MGMRTTVYTGRDLPPCWTWMTDRPADALSTTQHATLPVDDDTALEAGGYTHTLIFPVFERDRTDDALLLLLGLKRRGFGAGSANGFGGKIEPRDASICSSVLRELREETALQLPPSSVVLVGRADICVCEGEQVSLAVYTTTRLPHDHLTALTPPNDDDEITPFAVPLTPHTALQNPLVQTEVPEWAQGAVLRPEHILYLPLLLTSHFHHSLQTFHLSITFDEEPKAVSTGTRPENHRTVTHWQLTLFEPNP